MNTNRILAYIGNVEYREKNHNKGKLKVFPNEVSNLFKIYYN